MKPTLTALILAIGLANAAQGQDVGQLPDDQLLGAVVTATDDQDADRLLELMLEVQARGLLMFPATEVCEFTYPDTAFFRNEIFRGAVRRAFATEQAATAMQAGDCGCIYQRDALDSFLQNLIGKSAVELTTDEYSHLRRYRRSEWDEIDVQYQNFHAESCGG